MIDQLLNLAVKLVPVLLFIVQLFLLGKLAVNRNRNPLAWIGLGLLWLVPALVFSVYFRPSTQGVRLLFWILWIVPPLLLLSRLPVIKFDSKPATLFGETEGIRRKKQNELVAKCFFGFMAAAMVIPLFLIVGYIVVQGWPALSWEFLTENPRSGGAKGGIWAAIVGTFYIVFFSLIISAPIGVLAAVYLNEYATESWFTRIVNLAVVNLAGVPSIVHGLFGVGAFVYFANFNDGKKSIIAAALTLAVMTLPVIIASTKEALSAVPRQFREACWNVGATRWQTIWKIVLPNSISGILTGVILQVSRTAGETAPVMLTGVATYKMLDSTGLFLYHPIKDQCMALSMHLYYIATQANNVPKATPFAIATVLIGVVLIVNAAAIAFRVYLRSRKKW